MILRELERKETGTFLTPDGENVWGSSWMINTKSILIFIHIQTAGPDTAGIM